MANQLKLVGKKWLTFNSFMTNELFDFFPTR